MRSWEAVSRLALAGRDSRSGWSAADRRKRYAYNNRPVLDSGKGDDHNFLPGLPAVDAYATLQGAPTEPEPLFEIRVMRAEPGGYDFKIGLDDGIGREWSFKVDWLVRKLSREEGVDEVLREDRVVCHLEA